MAELVFQRQAAAEYDRAFAHVARYFMPFVLRAARIAMGMRVLDIAAGTGLSAEAACRPAFSCIVRFNRRRWPESVVGSFATGSSQQQVRPCPLCPDDNQNLQRKEMSRWAITPDQGPTPKLLRIARKRDEPVPVGHSHLRQRLRSITPFDPTIPLRLRI
jgi:hypothetical protein